MQLEDAQPFHTRLDAVLNVLRTERLQNPAVRDRASNVLLEETGELLAQRLEVCDLALDCTKLGGGESVDLAAGTLPIVRQVEQGAHLLE